MRHITRATVPFVALFMGLAGILPPGSGTAQESPPPAIAVSGTGTVEADPDLARVTVGVENQAATAREAQAETNRVAAEILSAVSALGISEESVQTSRLGLHPVYESSPERPRGEPTLVGYRAANTVSVELADLSRVGPVVDAAIGAGANRIEGVSFELRDDAAARAAALAAAVDDARAKAETIARALGVGLGPVLETVEGGVSVPPIRAMERAEAMMMQDVSTPVSPGRIRVRASLTIRYRIEPPPGGGP